MKIGFSITTPKVQPLLMPVLRVLEGGAERTAKEIRDRVAANLNLDDEYVKRPNPKTRQPYYENHVAWVFVYLTTGEAIKKIETGLYQIAGRGTRILQSGVSDLTINEAKNVCFVPQTR